MLRTPTSYRNGICFVGVNGYADSSGYDPNCDESLHGICPAMRLGKAVIPRGDAPAEKKYTVRFISNGNVISTAKYKEGETIEKPENPWNYPYYFVRWEPAVPATMPAEDLVFNAVYTYNPTDNPTGNGYQLPEFPGKSAPYKTYVTLNINLPGIPQDAIVHINGAAASVNNGVYSADLGQVTSGKDITVTVIQNGNTLDSGTVKLTVKDDFISRLSSVFSNFIFNMFKWRTVQVNI
jgi:hypothetical protein